MKAANRGITDIRLRERGTKKVHIFTGERKQIKKPKNAPAWMPAKIWKPNVKKVSPADLEMMMAYAYEGMYRSSYIGEMWISSRSYGRYPASSTK